MRIFVCVVLFIFLGPVSASAQPITIKYSAKGVVLQGEELPLQEWARIIEKRSGIHLSLPESIRSQIISADIQKPDWQAAVRALLEGYNVVELWKSDARSSRILVLSQKDGFISPGSSASQNKNSTLSLHADKDPGLYREIGELEKISLLPNNFDIPPVFFDSHEIRSFLVSQKIYSPEDWKSNPLRSRVAKRNALKRMQKLLYEHQQGKIKK